MYAYIYIYIGVCVYVYIYIYIMNGRIVPAGSAHGVMQPNNAVREKEYRHLSAV